MASPTDEAAIAETRPIKEIMEKGGWLECPGGGWSQEFVQATQMPTVDGVRLKSRLVRDMDTGVLLETLLMGPATKPSQVKRNLKRPRNLRVVLEVGVEDEGMEESWESQPMEGGEASSFRALAARLNYLAVDRADILYASKEVSRGMSSPKNGDWEGLKRLCRYLIQAPRIVHFFEWQEMPDIYRYIAIPTGPDARGHESRHQEDVSCMDPTCSWRTPRRKPT